MTTRHRITCITKSDRQNPHERIVSVGGANTDGTRWKLDQQRAIQGIQSEKWSFYVERPSGKAVNVTIATSAQGNLYLKTEADGLQPNNLLALPECP